MRNPFSAGSWVSGKGFIGREEIMQRLIYSNENCDWVQAQRRMGKTSLLRQLEEKINKGQIESASIRTTLAVFWDIQGSYDASGLLESLEDALDDSYDLFPQSWHDMDPSDFQADHPHQTIKNLTRQLRKKAMGLTLLIDEAEELMTLNEKNPETLARLRKVFHTSSNIHTIICSTPRLENLRQHQAIETSPFLHGFQVHYLSTFNRKETQQLLDMGNIPADIGERIYQLTHGNPYQIQLFAKYFFENRDFEETSLFMQSNPSLSQVHDVNLGLLTEREQEILSKFTMDHLQSPPSESNQLIFKKLIRLGYLSGNEKSPSIASDLFHKWLKRYFSQNLNLHPKDLKDMPLSEASSKIVRENILNLYQYLLQKMQQGYRLNVHAGHFNVSSMDKKAYPTHEASEQKAIAPNLNTPLWSLALQDLIILTQELFDFKKHWSCFRLMELANNLGNTTEEEILDLMNLIREEARLESEKI
ncbi:MAG: hypothetical protein CR997_07965 [Acidobacteria bacterium]|nr:MAG: hypothetical protein CR997_07965 [Acidobacteriota bacterium]